MPQLQINQGPQDALLYDNTRSYFTNVGYVRTSNFQVEYRNVDAQNTPQIGSTCHFVIPKAADLLGPVDLIVDLNEPEDAVGVGTAAGSGSGASGAFAAGDKAHHVMKMMQWVDEVGFAMIEKCEFSVGSNTIETISGEEMQIKNELMTSDEQRLGYHHTLKTGKAAFRKPYFKEDTPHTIPLSALPNQTTSGVNADYTRIVSYQDSDDHTGVVKCGKRQLIIPLAFFFTKHVSQYFPLAAVAGCNDIRITIKFRPLNELLQFYEVGAAALGATMPSTTANTNVTMSKTGIWPSNNPIASTTQLRCHYVHVTGPEATTLMNKEHVRLLKLWQHQVHNTASLKDKKEIDMDLSFLHPVTTLIITIRRKNDMNTQTDGVDAMQKGFFFYHGDGTNPNYDTARTLNGEHTSGSSYSTIKVSSIQLTLNGQERHPGLDKGIDANYLKHRLLPMLHSNSNAVEEQIYASSFECSTTALAGDEINDVHCGVSNVTAAAKQRLELMGSKSIFVYPFSLNPEGSNPSGAVNFSKVSHAKLRIYLEDRPTTGPMNPSASGIDDSYQVDVYGLYYNWLSIKDGRALLSFA